MLQRITRTIQTLSTPTSTRAVRSSTQTVVRNLERDALHLSAQARQRLTHGTGRCAGTASEGTIVGLRRESATVVAKASGHAAPLPDLQALIPDSPTSPVQFSRGGFKKLFPKNRVEGSAVVGGTQPSFLIEHDSEPMRELLKHARMVGSDDTLSLWGKIDAIQTRVRKSIRYPVSGQQQGALQSLNQQHLKGAIGIGEYHRLGLADCRGFAVTTQMLLQEAQIDSYFGYARTFFKDAPGVDHAFNVVKDNGKLLVVDTLNQSFNKIPVETMLTRGSQNYRFELHEHLPYVQSP